MAKKKEAVTPEQRLQEALVPCTEWPYKLPKNWCWTYLKSLSKKISDGSHNPPKDSGEGIPLLSATNIHNHIVDIDGATRWITEAQWIEENKRTQIETGDVLLTIVATLGRTAVVENETFALQRSVAVIKPTVNSHFLSYYFESPFIQQFMQDNAKGTAQKGFYLSALNNLYCPLPPLPEQQRIVERIESLFAQLDEAKEKAQAALDSFEPRKAAILHKAFTGELTAKWREEHGTGMKSWCNTTLGKIVIGFKYGTSEKSDYSYPGMPVFRIPNITDDGLSFDDLKFLPHQDITDENQIHENEILTIRSNGSRDLVGKSVLVPHLDKPYAYASFLIRIQPAKTVIPQYLVTFLNSTDARGQMFAKAKSSSGINNINSKELGAILLSLPSIPEQLEIVRILDSLLSKEQQAKESAEAVLEQIDLTKKAILSRAFRGELGTNDPSEESATELLKEILAQPKEKVQRKKPTFVPDELLNRLETELEKQVIKQFLQNPGTDLSLNHLMSVSSQKFDIMQTIRNLQNRGILERINEKYRLRT